MHILFGAGFGNRTSTPKEASCYSFTVTIADLFARALADALKYISRLYRLHEPDGKRPSQGWQGNAFEFNAAALAKPKNTCLDGVFLASQRGLRAVITSNTAPTPTEYAAHGAPELNTINPASILNQCVQKRISVPRFNMV
ncbi:hypothetical protein CRM22_011318 [Opisthorchis felineus]|uniref:Uncharacterized protein n=1 Tax=Opisthorchis felineus TaxID=147828 RepID=A0A4V3S7M5_OPIFE|nr:hypothetical protein CRM22_011318 [Opisthorchis felineus]